MRVLEITHILFGLASIFIVLPIVSIISISIIFSLFKNNKDLHALRARLPITGMLCAIPFFAFLIEAFLYSKKGKFVFSIFTVPGMAYAFAVFSFLIWIYLLLQKKRGKIVSDRFFITWGLGVIIFQVLPVFIIILGISYNYLAGNIPE